MTAPPVPPIPSSHCKQAGTGVCAHGRAPQTLRAKPASHVHRSLRLSTSVDGMGWTEEAVPFDPKHWLIDSPRTFAPMRAARYVRYAAATSFKITVLEVEVYGRNRTAAACPNNCSLHGQSPAARLRSAQPLPSVARRDCGQRPVCKSELRTHSLPAPSPLQGAAWAAAAAVTVCRTARVKPGTAQRTAPRRRVAALAAAAASMARACVAPACAREVPGAAPAAPPRRARTAAGARAHACAVSASAARASAARTAATRYTPTIRGSRASCSPSFLPAGTHRRRCRRRRGEQMRRPPLKITCPSTITRVTDTGPARRRAVRRCRHCGCTTWR